MKITKKILSFLLAALIVLSVVPLSVSAANGTDDGGFAWVSQGDSVRITGYTGGETDVVIPESIDGLPVTRIYRYAFTNANPPIERIVIPEGVTTLDMYAFARCESLREISIPSTITDIPERAFHMTTSLTSIIFPNGDNIKSIGMYAFYKSACGNAPIGDKLETIKSAAFLGCKMDEVVIPSGVTNISGSAFSECSLKRRLFTKT